MPLSFRPFHAKIIAASVAAFLLIGVTAACALTTGGEGTWRYRMMVTVETPEGDKTGYSVWQVSADKNWAPLPEQAPMSFKVKGEAVVVDLGQRGVLFALLRGGKYGVDYSKYILFDVFPSPAKTIPAGHISVGRELPPQKYPMLVRFRDMTDPKTVEAVKYDDLASSFGEGIKLKSITIAVTGEPVTTGIVERYLPWVPVTKGYIDGAFSHHSNELSNTLDVGDFKRGK